MFYLISICWPLSHCINHLRYEGALERRSNILDVIRSLELPDNPLDNIIDQVVAKGHALLFYLFVY